MEEKIMRTTSILDDIKEIAEEEKNQKWTFELEMVTNPSGEKVDIPLSTYDTYEEADKIAHAIVGTPYVPRTPCSSGDVNEVNHQLLVQLDRITPSWSIVDGKLGQHPLMMYPSVTITKRRKLQNSNENLKKKSDPKWPEEIQKAWNETLKLIPNIINIEQDQLMVNIYKLNNHLKMKGTSELGGSTLRFWEQVSLLTPHYDILLNYCNLILGSGTIQKEVMDMSDTPTLFYYMIVYDLAIFKYISSTMHKILSLTNEDEHFKILHPFFKSSNNIDK